jgi:MoaA/NifB/PqqE/SkfB family radical SAM enzyme
MRTLSPRLAARALWQLRIMKRPYVLSHGITSKCNLKCRFCEYWRDTGKEMSTPEIFCMLEDARSFGIGAYNAWTAEPLIRSDLPMILKRAKALGLMTSIVTNGKLLTRRIDELSDLDYLSVSVDGIESHQWLRGIPLDGVLKGIRAAKDAGHEILINCVVSEKNHHELEDLVHLAEEMGTWISFEPINQSEGVEGTVWEELGIKDIPGYKRAIDRLIELKKKGAPIINSITYLKMIRSQKPDFLCHASDIILHVAADGTVINCRARKEPLGKVSDGISNVWRSSADKRLEIKESCKGCLFFGYAENSLLYEFVPEVMVHYEWM